MSQALGDGMPRRESWWRRFLQRVFPLERDAAQPVSNPAPAAAATHEVEIPDLFYTPWVKAFIRANHAHELETVDILLSLGQQLMQKVPANRAGQHRLDLALGAILRAAVLVGKAAYDNLRSGVYEPALGQTRTLLELDLNLEYLLEDPATKDQRADRYWMWSYRNRKGPLAEQLNTPDLRSRLDAGHVAWMEGRLRVYQQNLDAFPEASGQNKAQKNWHPHRTVKGLASHLGRQDDYLRLYAPFSGMNVHAADPETHVVIEDSGAVHIKPLATTDPHPVTTAVNLLGHLLIQLLERLRDEWTLEETPFGRLLTMAKMRFIGEGDGKIPAELQPETWASAILVTHAPIAEPLEEIVQLVLVSVQRAPEGRSEGEIRDALGLQHLTLGARGEGLLRILLDHLVEAGQLELDVSVRPHRYRVPASQGS